MLSLGSQCVCLSFKAGLSFSGMDSIRMGARPKWRVAHPVRGAGSEPGLVRFQPQCLPQCMGILSVVLILKQGKGMEHEPAAFWNSSPTDLKELAASVLGSHCENQQFRAATTQHSRPHKCSARSTAFLTMSLPDKMRAQELSVAQRRHAYRNSQHHKSCQSVFSDLFLRSGQITGLQ